MKATMRRIIYSLLVLLHISPASAQERHLPDSPTGQAFKELARTFSNLPSAPDGGDIGLIKKDEMAPYMKDAILPMQPGEISQIIETDTTFQFFKLLSVTDGDVVIKVPFESVKDEIREILYNREMEEQYKAFV